MARQIGDIIIVQSAHRLGRGSQLASKVYRSLPREEQVYALFKELKSMAILAIKEGNGDAEVMMLLQQRIGRANAPAVAPIVGTEKTKAGRIAPSFTKRLFRGQGGRREKVLGRKRRHFQLAKELRE